MKWIPHFLEFQRERVLGFAEHLSELRHRTDTLGSSSQPVPVIGTQTWKRGVRAVVDGPKGNLSVIPAALSRSRGALSPAGP